MSSHKALILPSPGNPLQLTTLPTPTPGPDEVLVKVHSLALNPVDHYQRDIGFNVTRDNAVLGSDISGTIISTGSAVPSSTFPPDLVPGARVTALANSFKKGGDPPYGAFQEIVLVPADSVTVLPPSLTWHEGALLGMGVYTAWSGWYTVGLLRPPFEGPRPFHVGDNEGMLIWGGSASVGSIALQSAKAMGFRTFVTASEKHHAYLKTLGADHVFDYRDADVVGKIVRAAKSEGVTVNKAFVAGAGAVPQVQEILVELKQEGEKGFVAHAPLVEGDEPRREDIDVSFIQSPKDEEERKSMYRWAFNYWETAALKDGTLKPSPKVRVMEGGLEGLNEALDVLKGGVSGEKLVLDLVKE